MGFEGSLIFLKLFFKFFFNFDQNNFSLAFNVIIFEKKEANLLFIFCFV
jgi:hypothetical protein